MFICQNLVYFDLKQLSGTFYFVLILAVPVNKGAGVSPTVRLHVPSASLPIPRRLICQEESRAALETDLL